MSVRLMSEVFKTDLSPSQKLVLLVVADAASEEGVAWPKQSTIAARCSLTVRQVHRQLDSLRVLGLIEWTQRGLRRSNVYTVNVDALVAYADKTPASSPDGQDKTSASTPDKTSASIPDKTPASTPIENPKENPKENPHSLAPVVRPGRPRDELFEVVCFVCGIDWTSEMTSSGRGMVNRAVKELREIGATVEDVQRVAVAYRLRWPDIDLTPTALTKHWNLVRAPLPSIEGAARAKRAMMPDPDERRLTR